jgi:high-affinity iron transporter
MAHSLGILNIAVLVFSEGLECILVLAAIAANLVGPRDPYRRLVLGGAAVGFLATIVTWSLASGVINDLSQNVSALKLQAGTGLLAVVVLLVVMNWFFHRTYWTGWIAAHNRRKQALLGKPPHTQSLRSLSGFALLGFSCCYREGVELVLFLQSYRLRVGSQIIQWGVLVGIVATLAIGILTFVTHTKLPYRRMLVLTGALLGLVLFVMVGEQVQEMQLAHWLRTSDIPWLAQHLPQWTGVWFSVFPTIECLVGQALAMILVIGSYLIARERLTSAV